MGPHSQISMGSSSQCVVVLPPAPGHSSGGLPSQLITLPITRGSEQPRPSRGEISHSYSPGILLFLGLVSAAGKSMEASSSSQVR